MGFFQGALLKDPQKVLVQLRQVHARRVMKFTSAKDINTKAATIKAHVREAIAVEKAGLRIKPQEDVRFSGSRADGANRKGAASDIRRQRVFGEACRHTRPQASTRRPVQMSCARTQIIGRGAVNRRAELSPGSRAPRGARERAWLRR